MADDPDQISPQRGDFAIAYKGDVRHSTTNFQSVVCTDDEEIIGTLWDAPSPGVTIKCIPRPDERIPHAELQLEIQFNEQRVGGETRQRHAMA